MTSQPTKDQPSDLGRRIRERREKLGLTLTELHQRSGISKSYLSNLETRPEHSKPSAKTLYAIGKALNVTMSELLGEALISTPPTDIPPTLRSFADARGLTEPEVQMLAGIQLRGERPESQEQWAYIYNSIRMTLEDRAEAG